MMLDQLATVRAVGNDGSEVELTTTLACRMVHLSVQSMASSQDRDELAARRKLFFDPDFNMPEYVQIQLNGADERWNVVAGTFAKLSGPSRRAKYKRCEVIRAGDG